MPCPPQLSVGYTNKGLQKYTYGTSYDSVWAYGVSQTVPFPGKLVQKSKVASKDVEVLQTQLWALRLQTVAKVKELYYELFLAYRTIDLLEERIKLFDQVEKTALARDSAGMGDQRDAVMAQSEKYMLLERVEMARQRLQIAEGQVNAQLGRDVLTPVPRPAEPSKARTRNPWKPCWPRRLSTPRIPGRASSAWKRPRPRSRRPGRSSSPTSPCLRATPARGSRPPKTPWPRATRPADRPGRASAGSTCGPAR